MVRAKVGEERREQILTAFEACVLRFGLAKTTLQKVADESGLPRSLVRYFIGNRDAMVALLIDRMVERGEASMNPLSSRGENASLAASIDAMFERVFANEKTNGILGQLWRLAASDETVRARLSNMYRQVESTLVEQMRKEGIGPNDDKRHEVAFSILCLAYGSASFRGMFQDPEAGLRPRNLAHSLVENLRKEGKPA